MAAERIALESDSPSQEHIGRAAQALAEGALVAFPTETVYGLAANAAISSSVERLRDVKGRVASQPFTVHIGHRSACEDFVPKPTPLAQRFMKKAWPGPLTLIFPVCDPRKAKVHDTLSKVGFQSVYCDNSVAIRYPDHATAAAMLSSAKAPIIATSANVRGEPPPTEARRIAKQFGDKIDLILDGGPTRYRKSSTIVALNSQGYRLLRRGVLDERTIRRLASLCILFVCTGNTCRSPMAAGIFTRMVAQKLGCREEELPSRGVTIQSAGTLGVSGGRASPEAVEVCRKRGIDIQAHTCRGLKAELIHPADHIYVMARHHLDVVRSLAPDAVQKAVPLDAAGDIPDPIGGTIEDYEQVADRITDALKKRIEEVCL